MIAQAFGQVSAGVPRRSFVRIQKSSAQRVPRLQRVQAGPEYDIENPDSEAQRKKDESDKLRSQEKFMRVGSGEADCLSCGYQYVPKNGDPEYPIPPATKFQNLPKDWQCPVCGAEKATFQVSEKEIAGFEANQGYGLGANSLTSGEKSLLIYGSLAAFFALFLLGYGMQ